MFHLDSSHDQTTQKPTQAAACANMEGSWSLIRFLDTSRYHCMVLTTVRMRRLQDLADTCRLLNQRDSATAQLVSKGKEALETLGPGGKQVETSFPKTSR